MKDFNIFIFKTNKRNESLDIIAQSAIDVDSERSNVENELNKFVKNLEKAANKEEYNKVYRKGILKIGELYNFPDQKIGMLGYGIKLKDNKYVPVIKPVSIDMVKSNIDAIVANTFNKVEGDLLNMDFAYQLWREKFIEGNGTIWLTKEDVETAIALSDSAIADKYHPEQYLPQEDGKYDKEYFKNVRSFRMTCKHLKNLMGKKYEIYCIIFQRRGKLGEIGLNTEENS